MTLNGWNKYCRFSGVSVLLAADISFGEWEIEYQNENCFTKWGDGYWGADISYEFNCINRLS